MDACFWHDVQKLRDELHAGSGASLCATDDGRRLYLFGGHDGNGPLNDCYYLEVTSLYSFFPIMSSLRA